MRRAVLGILPLCWCASGMAQTTYYVDGSCGDDDWSGLSEICATPDGPKKTIGHATAVAGPGDTVLVAPGTYLMETNAFGIFSPITVRSSGGPFVTIIDGEYGDRNISVFAFGGGPGVIEGFTLTRVDTFQAGPIYVAEADLTLIDCHFIDNDGALCGVVWMDEGSINTVTMVDCTFQDNRSGGAGVVFALEVDVEGCTFIDNVGHNGSRGVVGSDSVSVTNSTFRGEAPLVVGDGPVTYCNIQGGYPGEGNIDADPLFADEAAGDLRLSAGSPCIDAGNNFAVPDWVRTDIAGLERFINDPATQDTGKGSPPIVDMGAHEFQTSCYPDFTGDGLLDLFDFLAYVNLFNAADCGRG